MNIIEIENGVLLEDVPDFNLRHTFLCGQCFRWDEMPCGSFIGVAGGSVIKITASNNNITLYNTNLQEFFEKWQKYFDFSRDYGKLKTELAKDELMRRATSFGSGIRILHQDTWETVISFIISASNNIPRIKGIISRLCECFGKEITMDGVSYYTFPTPEDLKNCTASDLAPLRCGYRDTYIIDAVHSIYDGRLDLDALKTLPLTDAKKMLLSVKGIGNKVADCILLFGCGRFGVFPVDTWIKKAMHQLYPEECGKYPTVREAGEKYFGENCGLAQQYIFFYARENKLG